MVAGLATHSTEGRVNLPDLAAIVQWFKERLRPADPAIGTGASDWTITAEYVPQVNMGGQLAWGAMCSPGDHTKYLTPEDIAERRAHILITEPKSENDITEIWTTFRHEFGHVLDSMVAPISAIDRAAAENAQHSWDNFLKLLTPEESTLFVRIKETETARAYRAPAKEGDMPDPVTPENKKEPDNNKPAMQEGGKARDISAITADIVKAVLAGQPTEDLAKELVAAQAMAGAAAGAAPATEPPPAPVPPTMGMKPDEAYARVQAANKEAIEAIIDANPHLTKEQAAMARKQSSAKDARELVATYPRPANQNDPAKLGMQGNPKVDGDKLPPMARAMKGASENPMLRKVLGMGDLNNDGVYHEPTPGTIFYIDGTERLNHQRAKYEAQQAKARGVA